MSILITGATGNVGGYLVKELQNKGVKIKAGVRDLAKAAHLQSDQVELVHFDFSQPETLGPALAGVEKLFLLPPAFPGVANLIKNIVDAAKAAGVKYIANLSVSGADSASPYVFAKLHGEILEVIKESGIPYTSLLPYEFYQNYIDFYGQSIKHEGKMYLPQGDAKKSLVDTADIAAAFATVLTEEGHAGKSYPIAAYDYANAELGATFTKVLGKEVTYVDIPDEAARQAMIQFQMPDFMVEGMMQLHDGWKQGWMIAPNTELKALLGRDPRTFEQFVKDNRAAWQ